MSYSNEEIKNVNKEIDENNKSIIQKRHCSQKIISNLFDSQKEFIVLGLCGKTGSGVSEVSNILNTDFEELNLPAPCEESKASVEKTEYRLLYNYASKNWKQFYKIKTSSLILSRAIEKSEDEFCKYLLKFIDSNYNGENEKSAQTGNPEIYASSLGNGTVNIDNKFDKNILNNKIHTAVKNLYNEKITVRIDEHNSDIENGKFKKDILEELKGMPNEFDINDDTKEIQLTIKSANMLFYKYLEKRKSKDSFNVFAVYEILYRYIFIELPKQAEKFWINLNESINSNITIMALQDMGNNLRVTKDNPFEKRELKADGYSGIAELINISIKLLRDYKAKKIIKYKSDYSKKLLKNNNNNKNKNNEELFNQLLNKYEKLSLKKALMSEGIDDSEDADTNTPCQFSDEELKIIKEFSSIIEQEKRNFIVIDSIKNPYESMYLKKRYSNYYLVAVYTDEKFRKERLEQNEKLEQKDIQAIDITEQLSAFKRIHKDYLKKKAGLEKVSSNKANIESENEDPDKSDETNESNTITKTPAQIIIEEVCQKNERIYNIVSGMDNIKSDSTYPFIMQNIEDCIDSADIFINNKNESGSFVNLKKKVLRYVCLIMYPGLVLPSKVERCMQTASTAKLCSGCISRQVGAVLTDHNYNLMAIGWNQQPETQIPCLYRDIVELRKHCNQEAYSDYENDDKRNFQKSIQSPVDNYYNITDRCKVTSTGRSLSYCFKDIYNEITKAKNQVYTRALHAEETAFLNLNKTGAHNIENGFLFTTSSPCELCSKKAMHMGIKKIYYIQPYPGISNSHVLSAGAEDVRPELELFTGAIGRAYTQLYTPLIPKKDELELWMGHKVSVVNYIQKKVEEK